MISREETCSIGGHLRIDENGLELMNAEHSGKVKKYQTKINGKVVAIYLCKRHAKDRGIK